jgi:hypothetical protein
MVKVYLAGPMRGIAEFNFPAFIDAAAKLRAFGYEVWSPAERDINSGFDPTGMRGDNDELGPSGFNLREALAEDLAYVTREADIVVLLPGWEKSIGAAAEAAAAHALGLEVLTLAQALGEEEPEPERSPREQSLRRAISYVCGDRNNAYGPPTQDFERTADLWTAFGFRFVAHKNACTCGAAQPIVPHQIGNAQILLKQSRLAWQPEKADSWDDTSGYAACGYECTVEGS